QRDREIGSPRRDLGARAAAGSLRRRALPRATNPGLPAPMPPTVTYGPSGTGTGTGTFTARPAIQGHSRDHFLDTLLRLCARILDVRQPLALQVFQVGRSLLRNLRGAQWRGRDRRRV